MDYYDSKTTNFILNEHRQTAVFEFVAHPEGFPRYKNTCGAFVSARTAFYLFSLTHCRTLYSGSNPGIRKTN